MTSNVSFWTNCKQNFKRRSWATMILGLYFFVIYVVTPIIMVSQLERPYIDNELKYMRESFQSLMGFNYFTGTIMAMFAVLFALHGYSYLFNRRKMDLYLSVPVSTSRRFFVIQVTGISTFIIQYVLFAGLGLVIASTSSLVTLATIQDFLLAFFLNLLLFISIYELTTIAVMMTGHVIVAILAFLVFSVYELLIALLHNGYLSIFTEHLIVRDLPAYVYSSPFYPYFSLQGHYRRSYDLLSSGDLTKYMFGLCFLCVVFFIIAFSLYKKRPNEATDCAIAFPKTKSYINIALQVLAGLGGGLFFYSISYENYAMAIFGIVLGSFLLFCAMNIIFAFDIRSIFKNWKTFFISIAIILLYFFIIISDPFGIDDYIPKEEKIASCGIYSYEINTIGYNEESFYNYYLTEDSSPCTEIQVTEIEPFIALAEAGIALDYSNTDDRYRTYTICFHLENGRNVYRRYTVPDTKALPELEQIFNSSSYIDSMKSKISENTTGKELDPYFDNGIYEVHLSSDCIDEILDAYNKDLNYYSFEENILGTPISQWVFYSENYTSYSLPIYNNFSYTLKLLNTYNLADDISIDPSEVARIQLYLYPEDPVYEVEREDVDIEEGVVYEEEYIDLSSYIEITNPEEIAFMLENSIPSKFDSFDSFSTSTLQSSGVEYNVDMLVFPVIGSEHEEELQYTHFRFYGDLPEFIAENYYLEY